MAVFRRFPFAFPFQGPMLVLLALLYLLPGLIGHEPWKSDDATHFGVVYSMLQEGHWLTPRLAGEPWYGEPPLFFWLGALFARLFGWLLPLHDAARLATGACGAFFLLAVGNAAAELHGAASRRVAVPIAMGCLGLLMHVHESQPAVAVLAGFAGTLWGVALMPRLPHWGGAIAGISAAAAFLSGGLPGLLITLPMLVLPLAFSAWRRNLSGTLLALALAVGLAALWPLALAQQDPAYLARWWQREMEAFGQFGANPRAFLRNLWDYLTLLSWFAWPALPLVAWTLWRERSQLRRPGIALPVFAFLIALAVLALRFDAHSNHALPVLAPLVLLATPAGGNLRRGAANAFDWFGMMTFTLAAGLIWLGWVAMVFGVPPKIAANAARLEPGFHMPLQPVAIVLAVLLSLAWLWLILFSPRSPLRGVTHWAAGLITLWGLLMALWLPIIDYGKSYRPMAEDLARHLPAPHACIASHGLGPSQRASLYYFAGIITQRGAASGNPACNLLLIQDVGRAARGASRSPGKGWQEIWQGRRAGDPDESYRLFRRNSP